MNKTLMALGLIILPILGHCDTLDYWNIFYNEAIIAAFNASSPDVKITLDRSEIKEGDNLTVRYQTDSPCLNCKFSLFVRDEKKRKLGIIETSKSADKLSFELSNLIALGDKNNSKRYDFYYWQRDASGNETPMQLVLQLNLK